MGRYLPVKIRMDREWRRLNELATQQGFENANTMLHDLYVGQGLSLKELCSRLFISMFTLRKWMAQLGIQMKARGGRHDSVAKFEITKELFEEVSRDGVTAVAERLGVDRGNLQAQMVKWYRENNK